MPTSYTTLQDWMQNEAIPFSLDAPDGFIGAVDALLAALGERIEILGMGEALHGSEEILQLRNRLFQHLVAAHGYSAIALESSFPRRHLVNEYIAGRGSLALEAVLEKGTSHGFGALEANRELIEWMRAYNAENSHAPQLHFYGFDSPTEMTGTDSPRQLLTFVLDYLDELDEEGTTAHRDLIESLLGEDDKWENPAVMMDPTQGIGLSPEANALRIATEDLITELEIRRPELIAKSDAIHYLEAARYAAAARQLLTYHAGLARKSETRLAKLLGLRDAMMADNLTYIVNRERGHGKVLAFAHNSHLKRGQAQWQLGPQNLIWWPAGSQLAAMLGPRYAVIGMGVGVSEDNGIPAPEARTLEAQLTSIEGPQRFITTHLGQGLPTTEIAALPSRSSPYKNPTYFPFTPQSFTDFDALVVLDATTYNRGGPHLPK